MYSEGHIIRLKKIGESQPVVRPATVTPHKRRLSFRKKLMFTGVVVMIGIFLATFTEFVPLHTAASQTRYVDDQGIVAEIGTLIELPEGVPTIAKVANLGPLEGEVFFKHAAVDDVVLMYAVAGRAILYRPSEHKIIEVAPISMNAK